MKKILLSVFSLAVFIISCEHTQQPIKTEEEITKVAEFNFDEETEVLPAYDKEIELSHGFKIGLDSDDDAPDWFHTTYLEKNGRVIYTDGESEFSFENELFPMVNKTGLNSFELLLEVDNRPSKNHVRRLRIRGDKIIGQDKLPSFDKKLDSLKGDATQYYAGYWDYTEMIGDEENQYTGYSPYLYYYLSDKGLILDSVYTKEEILKTYGEFHGFEPDLDRMMRIGGNR